MKRLTSDFPKNVELICDLLVGLGHELGKITRHKYSLLERG